LTRGQDRAGAVNLFAEGELGLGFLQNIPVEISDRDTGEKWGS
jgi:hypothetical protein